MTQVQMQGSAILVVTLLALAGCGAQPLTNNPYDPYGYGNDPYGSGSYSGGIGSGYGSSYGSGASYGSNYGSGYGSSYGNTYAGATSPTMPSSGYVPGGSGGPQLTLGHIDKTSTGMLLWKRLQVVGQIKNGTSANLSGEVQISFTKKGKVVETQFDYVTDLAPGQSHTFTLKSKKVADDAEVNVRSQPGSPTANNPSYNGGYGTNYGSGYNSNYGSGYGSTTSGYPSAGTYGY